MIRGSAIALLLLWVLAVFTGRTMGGFIHVLLVLGLVLGLASYAANDGGRNPQRR